MILIKKPKYDYLIVGAGIFGSVCAHELTKKGKKCLVIDKRDVIGGNCYTENVNGIHVHKYGAHIFHTNDKFIWDYVNQFAEFRQYTHNVIANYKGNMFTLPFNMWTFNQLWGCTTETEAKQILEGQTFKGEITNLEEQAMSMVGEDIYLKLIKGYTEKQWRKPCNELPKEIIKRLPVRFTYDNNYFNDKYQGIPIGGYTQIFEKLLDGIDVKLNTDYFNDELPEHNKVIYTGPIDKFYNYKFGELEYKTTKFEHNQLDTPNYQGCAIMNYTDSETPYTRTIEHKHFEFGDSDTTWVTHEYPIEYNAKTTEPYYPVNDSENNEKYNLYKSLVNSEKNVIFGGRLAEYKYYDMHQVIESALKKVNEII